jgi:hypothetical protein
MPDPSAASVPVMRFPTAPWTPSALVVQVSCSCPEHAVLNAPSVPPDGA